MDSRNFIDVLARITRGAKRTSWWQRVIFFAFGAFLLYAYLFFQRPHFSAQDVLVSIAGPETVRAQEEIRFDIRVFNRSKETLNGAMLIISLPEFMSFKEGGPASPAGGPTMAGGLEQTVELPRIAPQGEVTHSVFVFAKETERAGSIKARAQYSPANLAGVFESAGTFHVQVSSLPLTVIFDIPQKAVSGQRILGSIHFVAEKELETLPLFAKVVGPDGFTLVDSDPLLSEDGRWTFDAVEVGKSYNAAFEGVIVGQEGESKAFDVVFGSVNENGELKVQYKISREIRLSSAPLDFSETINGKEEYAAKPAEKLTFLVSYGNKSGIDIEDVKINVELSGDVFDLKSVDPGLGYFNFNSRTIFWDKNFIPKLSRLEKDESGTLNFSGSIRESFPSSYNRGKGVSGVSRATIEAGKIPLALKGLSLRAQKDVKVKLGTSLELSTKGYYYEGPFQNTGPVPPRVGEKTTYTVLWQVTNTVNEANSVRVEAPLSRDVAFEQNVYPKGANVTYDAATHAVRWDIGALAAGVGSIYEVETAAFQVSLVPKEEMRGKVVELVEQSKISGTDAYTNDFVEDSSDGTNTSLPDDAGIRQGDGVVQ